MRSSSPSEETPSTATVLAQVINEAGLPEGVFNLVHGHGAGAVGEFLTGHEGVDAIAFTGESATGAAIMRNAADHVTPVSFELGGKNPALVFADADLDAAVDGTVRSSFTHSGQICLCTERIYVERSVFDEFVEKLAARVKALDGYGPMISAEHRDKVLSYYRLAKEEGATIVAGVARRPSTTSVTAASTSSPPSSPGFPKRPARSGKRSSAPSATSHRSTPRTRPSRSPTTAPTASPPRSGRRTCRAPTGWRRRSRPASSG